MKVLVTGGAGFIGSHLATYLASRGDEVVILDNFSSGKWENLQGINATVIEGDITDLDAVMEAVKGTDVVFHHAALCSVARSMEDPVSTHQVNATGTLNVLEAARRSAVRRVMLASSSSIYGDAEESPKHERMSPAPLSPYAVSKLIGEHYCQMYWKSFGLETVALRYFNVFGPRQDPDSEYSAVIPKFVHAIMSGKQPHIYGDGSQSRDFTYVRNIVRANVAAAESPAAAGRIMNIACGGRYSLLELLNRLEAILGVEASPVFERRRVGDIEHSQACIDQAEKVIGFAATVDFEEGLRKTVDWFRDSMVPARTLWKPDVGSDTRPPVFGIRSGVASQG